MKFKVITLFPQMIEVFRSEGVIGQAIKKNLIEIQMINPREFTKDLHKTVDDRPFGGGDGMLMMVDPLEKALTAACEGGEDEPWIIFLSPQGSTLRQEKVLELSQKKNLILVCGRYAGVDQRLLNHWIDEEISIGDYVLSGGELGACVVMDAVSRNVPGVLGHVDSAASDSFSESLSGLLEAPSFTRPREFNGEGVPEILLSGNHAKIEAWRKQVSILTTLLKRPDLLVERSFSAKEISALKKFWNELPSADKKVLGLSALSDQDLEQL